MRPLPPVTDAFPAEVKPAWPGVYEVMLPGGAWGWYSFWTGEYWRFARALPESAATDERRSQLQDFSWRGLSADPATYAVPDDVDGPLVLPPITLVLDPLPDIDAVLGATPPVTRLSASLPSGWPVLLGGLLCAAAFLVSVL